MSTTRLPKFPKVRAEGKKIIITYRDGEEMSWGEEASEELAVSVSIELDLELKAIEYVKKHVYNFINEFEAHYYEKISLKIILNRFWWKGICML